MLAILMWIAIGWIVFSAIVMITQVGKPRGPITPGIAAGSVLIWGLILAFAFIPAALAVA